MLGNEKFEGQRYSYPVEKDWNNRKSANKDCNLIAYGNECGQVWI